MPAAPDGPRPAAALLALAREQETAGDLRAAASVYDQAFALDPAHEQIAQERAALLDRLAVTELGLRFRYVPAGEFLMGSESGDPDERPVHPVELTGYWISETPLSWADWCRLMGWSAPPEGMPLGLENPEEADPEHRRRLFVIHNLNKIRLQYCEDLTLRAAHDWHVHVTDEEWQRIGASAELREMYGKPRRDDPERPYGYEEKPVVCISWPAIQELCMRHTTTSVLYRLPTEAEWEKAARGGLAGARYAWGDEPPAPDRCDFDRFSQFAIHSSFR